MPDSADPTHRALLNPVARTRPETRGKRLFRHGLLAADLEVRVGFEPTMAPCNEAAFDQTWLPHPRSLLRSNKCIRLETGKVWSFMPLRLKRVLHNLLLSSLQPNGFQFF